MIAPREARQRGVAKRRGANKEMQMTTQKSLSETDQKTIAKAKAESELAAKILASRRKANAKGKCPELEYDHNIKGLTQKLNNPNVCEGLAATEHTMELMRVFNVDRASEAQALLNSIIIAQGDDSDLEGRTNGTLALVEQIEPNDPVETMLAIQMVTTHSHAMDLMGIAKKHMLSEHFELFARHAERMLRIYGQQVSIMGKYRNGGKQTVEVKHIHVENGGQAIIGNVQSSRRGGVFFI